jgi:hypothetical protein
MASDYGRNFGFRRSDEVVRVSEGRVKTPKTGPLLLIGTAVEIDPDNAGFLRVAPPNARPRTGTCGLLVQEEVWDRTIYQSATIDSFSLGYALKNRLSVVTNGPGTKVWFQNTPGQVRADGRDIPAVSMFIATGVTVGGGLSWNGTQFVAIADPLAPTSFGEVTHFDAAKGYVELVLQK